MTQWNVHSNPIRFWLPYCSEQIWTNKGNPSLLRIKGFIDWHQLLPLSTFMSSALLLFSSSKSIRVNCNWQSNFPFFFFASIERVPKLNYPPPFISISHFIVSAAAMKQWTRVNGHRFVVITGSFAANKDRNPQTQITATRMPINRVATRCMTNTFHLTVSPYFAWHGIFPGSTSDGTIAMFILYKAH